MFAFGECIKQICVMLNNYCPDKINNPKNLHYTRSLHTYATVNFNNLISNTERNTPYRIDTSELSVSIWIGQFVLALIPANHLILSSSEQATKTKSVTAHPFHTGSVYLTNSMHININNIICFTSLWYRIYTNNYPTTSSSKKKATTWFLLPYYSIAIECSKILPTLIHWNGSKVHQCSCTVNNENSHIYSFFYGPYKDVLHHKLTMK